MSKTFPFAVVGDWHLAYVTAAGLTKLNHKTALITSQYQPNSHTIPKLDFFEPGLDETFEKSSASGLLSFFSAPNDEWTADYVWLCVDTPVDERDEPQLDILFQLLDQIKAKNVCKKALLVSSQIPIGFCQQVEKEYGFPVVCIPENLRLGQGLKTFSEADRVVIGSQSPKLGEEVKTLLSGIKANFVLCNLPTAEMIKHATNTFLANSISFANQIAAIGESFGVNSRVVGEALKLDSRIGSKAYVVPGLGFAGGTLPRDLRVLQKTARMMDHSATLIDSILEVNERVFGNIVRGFEEYFGGNLKGKTICVLGYTYKPDADTVRRSPAFEVSKLLKEKGAKVVGYDPVMNGKNIEPLASMLKHVSDWSQLPKVDGYVVLTKRPIFAELKFPESGDEKKPPLVFDAHGVLNSEKVNAFGLAYKPIWEPVVFPN